MDTGWSPAARLDRVRDHLFLVDLPAGSGWTFAVRGERVWRFGPFPTLEEATARRWALLQAFRVRAAELGGYLRILTVRRWLVVLPEEVPCAGLPLERAACSRHAPMPASA